MATAFVFPIGPLDHEEGSKSFLYAPVFNDVVLEHLVFAEDDEEGLARLQETIKDVELVCHPALTRAAEKLGFKVEQPNQTLSELRAEISLSLKSEDQFPISVPLLARRIFLRGLGALSRSFVWDMMVLGAPAAAKVEGEIFGSLVSTRLALAISTNPIGPLITVHTDGGAEEDNANLAIGMIDGPAYVTECLTEAYGLRFRPEFDRWPLAPQKLACLYATLGHAFHSLGVLPPGDDIIQTTLNLEGIRTKAEAELSSLPPAAR